MTLELMVELLVSTGRFLLWRDLNSGYYELVLSVQTNLKAIPIVWIEELFCCGTTCVHETQWQ